MVPRAVSPESVESGSRARPGVIASFYLEPFLFYQRTRFQSSGVVAVAPLSFSVNLASVIIVETWSFGVDGSVKSSSVQLRSEFSFVNSGQLRQLSDGLNLVVGDRCACSLLLGVPINIGQIRAAAF